MEISDTELRERLLAAGYVAPPITGTSKAILLKKLQSLENGTPFAAAAGTSVDEDEDCDKSSTDAAATIRQRSYQVHFQPQNVGTYSRCVARSGDFWDRIRLLGTGLLLLLTTGALFFVFKFIGDWSDRRYCSVHLADGVFPKCSEGGQPRVTCIPDEEMAFVQSNLNVLRAALHHATLAERCSHSGRSEVGDFIGLYPLFRDNRVKELLRSELGFEVAECEALLQNAKVLFKANPRLDVKVLADGLLYRNQRLLRSCGFTASWNTVAYTYALYALTSFAVVWCFYNVNRWVRKLRKSDDHRRRLIKDIVDLLEQYESKTAQRFLPVDEVRRWIDEAVLVDPKLWTDVEAHLEQRNHDSGLAVETKSVHGQERRVFYLKN